MALPDGSVPRSLPPSCACFAARTGSNFWTGTEAFDGAAPWLALSAGVADRGDQIVDFHPLAKIRIDEPRLDPPVWAHHKGGRYRKHPAVIALEIRPIQIGEQLPDFGPEPNRKVERERVSIIQVGQYRKWRTGLRLESFGISLRFGHDGDGLSTQRFNPPLSPDHGADVQSTVGAPVSPIEHHDDR